MINERIFNWFNRGKVQEALLGEGEYFIPDPTYRHEHNSLLVIRQLSKWVDDSSKKAIANDVFLECITDFLSSKRLSSAFGLTLAYFIVKEGGYTLPVNEHKLVSIIKIAINKEAITIVKDEKLRTLAIELEKYLRL